jgi:hypothetical protein
VCPGAPPQPLGGWPWPAQLASGGALGEVVSLASSRQEQKTISGGQSTSLNVSKYRQLFGLPKEEQLSLRTTCSMRKENNALKDTTVQFGDLYVFEAHLCFDWKVFGFHKQQAPRPRPPPLISPSSRPARARAPPDLARISPRFPPDLAPISPCRCST